MNCEKCQELLSDYLDGAIGDDDRATFDTHLQECLPCFNVHAEVNAIVSFCHETRGQYAAPPNVQALWLRILNTVEAEQAAVAQTAQRASRAARPESWWSRLMGRSWELSLPQVAAAVVAIVVLASLATVFSLRSLEKGAVNVSGAIAGTTTSNNSGRTAALVNSNYDWQQQQIKYWNQVVEQRKANWNPQVRADFERNMALLDETVQESLDRLSKQPHDEITEEMLNAALNDKMQLLKEFSDL